MYLRTSVKHGILKLAFFRAKDLRLRSVIPLFEIYFSKREGRFLTYDTVVKKWRTAMFNKLEWSVFGSVYSRGYWISPKDADKVKSISKLPKSHWKQSEEIAKRLNKDDYKLIDALEASRLESSVSLAEGETLLTAT